MRCQHISCVTDSEKRLVVVTGSLADSRYNMTTFSEEMAVEPMLGL